MTLLEFIFQGGWHFLGIIVLWLVFCVGLAMIVSEIRK